MSRLPPFSTLALITLTLTGSEAGATTIIPPANASAFTMNGIESDARAAMRPVLRHRAANGDNVTIIRSTGPVVVTRGEGVFAGFLAYISSWFGGYYRDTPHAVVPGGASDSIAPSAGVALMQADTGDSRANRLLGTVTRRLSH